MYLVFPVIVIVTVIVLLQCLSCSFGQTSKVNVAEIIITVTMTMTMTKNNVQNRFLSLTFQKATIKIKVFQSLPCLA